MQHMAYDGGLYTKPILIANKPPIRWLVFYIVHGSFRFAGKDAVFY
jgi:hypothetical protein